MPQHFERTADGYKATVRIVKEADIDMTIYSIWESRFAAADAARGRALTEAIWRDMPAFAGYVDHQLLTDADDPGHLIVIGRWADRGTADASLREYASNPNALAVNSLVREPRRRTIATADLP